MYIACIFFSCVCIVISRILFLSSYSSRSIKFYFLLEILHELFLVSTPIGDNIRDERVHRDCPKTVLNKVTHVDLIELTMLDFDIILGMD